MAGNNPAFYWDTCIFIAWIKNESRKAGEMEGVRDCIERFKRREISIMTSVLTTTEISVAKIPAGTNTMLDELMQRPNFTQIGMDIRVARLARDLRNHYLQKQELKGKTLTVPDAIHLATAILYKSNEFHTFDGADSSKYNALGLLPLSGDVGGHKLTICMPPQSAQIPLIPNDNDT